MASVSLPLSGSTIVGSVVVLSAHPAPPWHGTSRDGGRDEHGTSHDGGRDEHGTSRDGGWDEHGTSRDGEQGMCREGSGM